MSGDVVRPTRGTSWIPLLEGDDRVMAERIVTHVVGQVAARAGELCGDNADASIAGGTAGIAIMMEYVRRWKPDLADQVLVLELATHAAQADSGRESGSSLYFGAVGVAWMLSHLGLAGGSVAEDDVCSEVDRLLTVGIPEVDWRFRHELFRGLTGLGIYALERRQRFPKSQIWTSIVDALESSASHPADDMLAWECDPHRNANPHIERATEPYYNLGVPHGSPGPMCLLARAARDDQAKVQVANRAIRWLLHKQAASDVPCFGMVADYRPHVKWLPTAWCYGDLGIAAMLESCGSDLGRGDLRGIAQRLARLVARSEMSSEGTSLCHGSAGNAHLFARLYQRFGDNAFRTAALWWYRRLLNQWEPSGGGFAGFRSSLERDLASAGFLRGAAGVALSLLGGISDVSPDWDRLLLLSTA